MPQPYTVRVRFDRGDPRQLQLDCGRSSNPSPAALSIDDTLCNCNYAKH
jgi:hypothetical protein